MILTRQKMIVEKLSSLAEHRRLAEVRRREAVKRWKQKTFRGHDILAWSFAGGALWSLLKSNDKSPEKSRLRRFLLGTINLGLLAWRAHARS